MSDMVWPDSFTVVVVVLGGIVVVGLIQVIALAVAAKVSRWMKP